MSFDTLGLSNDVLRAVADVGYAEPTPIQAQAIPVVLAGRDVLGCAQTGTGKTAGFTLPMIEILSHGRSRARMPRSLVLEPTRELAAQVADSFGRYGKYHKLSMALLIGGESFSDQERALDRGVDVLIATPGRLIDLFERGKIILNDVRVLVIDEADRMLDMGFIPDVERIVKMLPGKRQTLFFSATMPPEIRRLADAFLENPKEISVAPPASPAETVTQYIVPVRAPEKREALRSILRAEADRLQNAILFCNRKRDVDLLFRSLVRHGFDAAALHGDLPQPKRMETLDRFRRGEVKLLVASDVAARGLDIMTVSHVFNFDVPIHAEDYVHRIGRTGRAGRSGASYTLCAPGDKRFLDAIEKLIGREIPRIAAEGVDTPDIEAEAAEEERSGGRGRRGRTVARRGDADAARPRRSERTRERREPAPRRAEAAPAVPAQAEPLVEAAPRPAAPAAAAQPAPRLVRDNVKPARRAPASAPTPFGRDDDVPAFLLRPVKIRQAG